MTEQPAKPPLERFVDLGRLSDAGEELVITPTAEDLAALAHWAEVDSIDKFEARIDLARKSLGNFHYAAEIEADLTQSCVVTLEPVKSHISKSFSRELHLSKLGRHSLPGSEELTGPGDDEAPEELDSPHFDVAGPVLEEFSLAIDPYPRAPGAAFQSPAEAGAESENPFAVLKRLKTGV